MKKSFIYLFVLLVFLLNFYSCSLGNTVGKIESHDTLNSESRGVRTSNLWEPLNSFNSSLWNKADWTNGGMFNVGWKPDHVTFNNSKLILKLDGVDSHGKPYTSGEYRSNQLFSYGKFDVNMKAAKGSGLVTSFFLYTSEPRWDEIDIEILGKDTTKVQFNYFVDGVGGNEKIIDLGFDASTKYVKYTIEYGNGYINWYVNDQWKWGVNNAGFNAPNGKEMPKNPMYIMMNLWPGKGVDDWLGEFNYTKPLYAYYDYIRYRM